MRVDRRTQIAFACALLLAPGVALAVPGLDQGPWLGWRSETVDTRTISGGDTAIAIDPDGNEHAFYNVGVWWGQAVVHATGVPVTWTAETVWEPTETEPGQAMGDAAIDDAGVIHIVHSWRKVVYSRFDGSWTHTVIETRPGTLTTYGAKIDLAPDGSPHIAFKASTAVRHAWKDNAGWHVETAATSSTLGRLDIHVATDGQPVVSYEAVASPTSSVWVARKSATGWGSPVTVGTCASHGLALDSADRAHLGCQSGSTITYHSETATGWTPASLVASGFAFFPDDVELEIDANDRPHIGFRTELESTINPTRAGQPRYATLVNGAWNVETIDWDGDDNGNGLDLTLDPSGFPHVSYVIDERSSTDGCSSPTNPCFDLRVASPLQALAGG
ncbi:MAG TPA: hypothetical protein VI997_12005 [Candidatus Thermoplasmatota archaeon]|nr:hypothetical protein [Candidatus Thermoplasmatota archaeon]